MLEPAFQEPDRAGSRTGGPVGGSPGDAELVVLPPRLDPAAGLQLRDQLLARRGNDLVLDASGVTSLSALALEVVIAAALRWQVDRRSLRVVGPSTAWEATCNTLGLDPLAPWRQGESPSRREGGA